MGLMAAFLRVRECGSQTPCAYSLMSWCLLADVIAQQDILVSDIEFAVGDHGVCPGSFVTPLWLIKTAFLNQIFVGGFDQCDRSRFASQV